MPRYDLKCTNLDCGEIFYDVVCSYEQSLIRKCGACLSQCEKYWGAMEPNHMRTLPFTIGELMEKDSFARNHTMPDEFFHEQTASKRRTNEKRDKDEAVRSGTLNEINRKRKASGLHPW